VLAQPVQEPLVQGQAQPLLAQALLLREQEPQELVLLEPELALPELALLPQELVQEH
jgi:hypothetical protein